MGVWGAVVEEGLEDEGGGDLVDDLAVGLAGVAGLVEDLVGFAGGEALVPEVDGEAGEGGELGGEGLGFGGLGAGVAGEVGGVADDDGDDVVAARQAGDGAEVFAGDAGGGAAPFESQHRLGGQA